jgi:predicted RNA-binding Zn-ribbon protein involved in translation (DUF1610 family)
VTTLRDLWRTITKVRHRGPQPKFCPMCGGHRVYSEPNFGILPTVYRCRDCSYEGPLVVEIEPDEGQDDPETDEKVEKEGGT